MCINPLVSIIVPVYNAEKTISVSLESLYAQTYKHLELLFVNDYCSDNSFEIIEKVISRNEGQSRIVAKIIHHEKNRGVAAARNTGLDYATGDYIYYVDADDWLEPRAMEIMVTEALIKDLDILGCEWYLTYKENERNIKQAPVTSADEAFYKMTAGVLRWNLWLFMVKRSLYEKYNLRFTEGQNMGEDMMVMGKLFLLANSAGIVHQPLYHYIQTNDNSLTKDISKRHLAEVIANVNELERFTIQNRGESYTASINYLKLNIKLPWIITDNPQLHLRWKETFPEANKYIMQNTLLPLRTRLLQWFASKGCFAIPKLYYKFVFIIGKTKCSLK